MIYDSTQDTKNHIETVQGFLSTILGNIALRSLLHDHSKLQEPEKSMYDEFTPRLAAMTYGSNEYKECLKQMGEALKHHYESNTHHPEHYPETDSSEAKILLDFLDNNKIPSNVDNIIRRYAKSLRSRINRMSLLDIVEMLADWKAAGMRHADGNIEQSLEINRKRFEMSDQLFEIFKNTVRELGW